jgi:hypothetical protein
LLDPGHGIMEILDLLTRVDLLASEKKIKEVSRHDNVERLRSFAEKKHQLQQGHLITSFLGSPSLAPIPRGS